MTAPRIERAATFRHGVHPEEKKDATCALRTERMPFVGRYVLPLSQHIGAPSRLVVERGQRVRRGQTIAEPGGFVSTALHAPVTGTVVGTELCRHPSGRDVESIIIEADPLDSQKEVRDARSSHSGDDDDRISQIQDAGIVGLGGAAFPTHVKLKIPKGKKVRFAILNGCECEPYLTCDHRIMVERPEAVVAGMGIIHSLTGAERCYIGIERNKPDAIEALERLVRDEPAMEVVPLEVKYPEGAEKNLIDAVLSKEVPVGKIPLDLEIVVQNVATAVALHDLWESGAPLIERVVTVTGDGIRRPANVVVPIGTPVRDVVEHCGGLFDGTRHLILGGPMMGMAQTSLDVPVLKGTSGILALREGIPMRQELPCIRCGRCLEACPMFLNPSRFAALVRNERIEELESHHVMNCFECASCSFVCPSAIPLVHLIRVGKGLVRERSRK